MVNSFNKEFVFNDFKKFLLRKKKIFEKNIYNSRRQKFLQKKKKRLGRSFFSRKFFFYRDKRYWASQSNFFLYKNYIGNLGGLKGLYKYTPFEKYFNFFLYKNSSPLFIFQSNLLIKKALNQSLLYYNKDHLNLVKFKSWKFWYYKNSKNLDIVEKNLYKNLNNFINSYKFHRVYTFINNKLNHNLKYFNLTTFFIFYLSSFFIGKKINKKLLVFSYLYFYQNFFKILTIPFNLYRFHSFLSILNKGSFNVLLYKNLNEYIGFRFKKNFTGLYISKLNGFFFYKKVYLPFLNVNKSGIPFYKNFYSLTYLEPFKKNLNLKEESFKFIAPLKLKVYKNFNDFLKFNIGIFSLKLFFYEKNNFKNKKRSKRGPFLRYRKNKKKQFLNNGRQKKKR